jgi:muramidase (phage lysozyme)
LKFNKYQWAAIAAGFITPALYFLIKKELQRMEQANKAQKNLRAFLVMIQYSEGTLGKDAYRMLFGGGIFSNFSDHPNTAISKGSLTSTAAGAYQILYRTWIEVKQKLGLPDFSPQSQDRAAIELIKRRKALEDVLAGRFPQAIEKCKKEWASLPGAGYNQRERSANSLLSVYKIAGGTAIAA